MINIKFVKYIRKSGRCEVDDYLDHLPNKVHNKFDQRITAIESMDLKMSYRAEWVRPIVGHKNLFEVRMRFSNRRERIMYCNFVHSIGVLLCGCTKTSPQVQRKAIKRADTLKSEFERRVQDHDIKII